MDNKDGNKYYYDKPMVRETNYTRDEEKKEEVYNIVI